MLLKNIKVFVKKKKRQYGGERCKNLPGDEKQMLVEYIKNVIKREKKHLIIYIKTIILESDEEYIKTKDIILRKQF